MGELFGLDGDLLERQYREHFSGYMHWDQRSHADEWILFPENMGSYIGIDEVALSRGELYTVVINKQAKGRKGTIIAIIQGTNADKVSSVLLQMPRRRRFQAREITLDMSPCMGLIARKCFPAARQVIDRFHVQQLAFEAVQEMRIKERWRAIDKENTAISYAKAKGELYVPVVYQNGDTLKQLLARSRYLLF